MEKVFVVDAVFTTSKEPRRQWEFVFSQSTFTGNSRAERKPHVFLDYLTLRIRSDRRSTVTSIEKRCLIASLNPVVFRFINEAQQRIGASWIRKPKMKLGKS